VKGGGGGRNGNGRIGVASEEKGKMGRLKGRIERSERYELNGMTWTGGRYKWK
jgi:hypothetical protein